MRKINIFVIFIFSLIILSSCFDNSNNVIFPKDKYEAISYVNTISKKIGCDSHSLEEYYYDNEYFTFSCDIKGEMVFIWIATNPILKNKLFDKVNTKDNIIINEKSYFVEKSKTSETKKFEGTNF